MSDIKRKVEELNQTLKEILSGLADDPSIPVEKRLNAIIHLTSLTCALVAVQPIPFADLFVLTPIQVVMVIFMSRAMGHPIGSDNAKEIVAYIIGVVGWGVLAKQVVLGLYKTILPFLGGFTTIPLVYAATYGLGYAAKTVLEARYKDQKISEAELKRISKEATQKAKEEKRDWTPSGIMKELESYRKKAQEYEVYKQMLQLENQELESYKRKNEMMERKLKEVMEQLKKSVPEQEWSSVLEDQEKQTEALRNELKAMQSLQKEHEQLKYQMESSLLKRSKVLQDRFRKCYPNIQIDERVLKEIAGISDNRLHKLEHQIGLLQHHREKVNFRDKIHGTSVREIGFDGDGRMYITIEGNRVTIHRVGDKKTQLQDIEWLRTKVG